MMSCGSGSRPGPSPRMRGRPTFQDVLPAPAQPLPRFSVEIPPPDLSRWQRGNCGIPGVIHLEASRPGPHVVLTALIHGNEYAGATVLDTLLRDDLRPAHGRLSLIFANLDAFARFDAANPVASRFVDEDMNRLWCRRTLNGPRQSAELNRARALLPVIESADILMDLHSMLWPGTPLILAGGAESGRRLSAMVGDPPLIVSDHGHRAGPRLIDFERFSTPGGQAAACLLEAGAHWDSCTVTATAQAVHALLRHSGLLPPDRSPPTAAPRHMMVTDIVTAHTPRFRFVKPFRGGQVVPRRGTLLAQDGPDEIRTPYDDCMLVMPNLRPGRGQTAVRLATSVPDPAIRNGA
ncbi:peptidase M14 [Gluconacetobacter azotocaptans]|uniref:Peptidase M14 n=1 Tax=Gluconacetobacter azotocaptans TaxID=142834 RepID=A0A7W4PFA7_9PROT|nr:succinylglutamate desuccinylase/aspartoacylase family protein [Gluconacetobacter azotocaptans]MBB2191608.1 peptidase M14 [Gluconacetobacter azotocaptans]MBM9403862.1 succinylglutamate desuccinylase/aspartoacylase family protein [Gluconacetobacter azotocaptans]